MKLPNTVEKWSIMLVLAIIFWIWATCAGCATGNKGVEVSPDKSRKTTLTTGEGGQIFNLSIGDGVCYSCMSLGAMAYFFKHRKHRTADRTIDRMADAIEGSNAVKNYVKSFADVDGGEIEKYLNARVLKKFHPEKIKPAAWRKWLPNYPWG